MVGLKEYRSAAAKRKMTGASAMTPVGVARAAKGIKLDAAVGGEVVKGRYHVVIYDRAGQLLWEKTLPLTRGRLSDDFAEKLARAIAAAGEQAAGTPQEALVEAPEEETSAAEDVGLDLTRTDAAGNVGVVTGPAVGEEPERDADLDDPNRRLRRKRLPVPLFRLSVGPATVRRDQCLRPGVKTCREYELMQSKPVGITINFTPPEAGKGFGYPGLALNAELFPLARLDSFVAQGFGVLVNFQHGWSETRIIEENTQGAGEAQVVTLTDLGFTGQLTWRYHFQMGFPTGGYPLGNPEQPLGWVGLRGGVGIRDFVVPIEANVSLPSSNRVGHGLIGFDAAIPIIHQVRVELGGSVFINPGPGREQIIGYGNLQDSTGGVVSSGFGLEAGLAGELLHWPTGGLGYTLRWRFATYTDQYKGQGQKWTVCDNTQCGGVGEESFHTLTGGITVSW